MLSSIETVLSSPYILVHIFIRDCGQEYFMSSETLSNTVSFSPQIFRKTALITFL